MKAAVYDYEGRYEIDQTGNIWSLRREKIVNGRLFAWAAKKLTPFVDANGYEYVNLGDGNSTKKFAVHRLVLISFCGQPGKNMIACHNDGNRLNNNLSNLRWDTPKNNYADSVKHKTNCFGEKNGRTKLTKSQVNEILLSKEKSTLLCKKYNVASSTIRAVRIKQNWKHFQSESLCADKDAHRHTIAWLFESGHLEIK